MKTSLKFTQKTNPNGFHRIQSECNCFSIVGAKICMYIKKYVLMYIVLNISDPMPNKTHKQIQCKLKQMDEV